MRKNYLASGLMALGLYFLAGCSQFSGLTSKREIQDSRLQGLVRDRVESIDGNDRISIDERISLLRSIGDVGGVLKEAKNLPSHSWLDEVRWVDGYLEKHPEKDVGDLYESGKAVAIGR